MICDNNRIASSFNLCYRYIDDLIVFNNKKFIDYVKDIYLSELNVEKGNRLYGEANFSQKFFVRYPDLVASTRTQSRHAE